MNSPLISVVVPVYNVEKYLSRCVDSILAQTYENLEIILVNDASTDTSGEIISKYTEQDERIVKVEHETNRGLFQARLTGAAIAHGKYLAFVDSDDYISIDWYRKLLQKAEETGSDIVVGEWCFDNDGQYKSYLNLDPFRIKDFELTGEEIIKAFMEQQGQCFSWTVVWNKLYSKSLWDRAVKEFQRYSNEHGHMLKWEDIAFSSGLWTRAKKVTNVHGILYYYFKHAEASTSVNKSINVNEKYITDASGAMRFMESQLKATGTYSLVEKDYLAWRDRAGAMLYHELVLSWGLKRFEAPIRAAFKIQGDFLPHKAFFYETATELTDAFSLLESIKQQICSPKTKAVSFDIFDTLLQRPFWFPTDLFTLLNETANEGLSAYIDFAQIRRCAEQTCRDKKRIYYPSWEEITLDEIYEEIRNMTGFSSEKTAHLKQEEIELEKNLCKARATGKELYELAKFAKKPVLLCSDMYLPEDVIQDLLTANGYNGWDKLYLSSTVGKTKATGNLYKYLLKDIAIQRENSVCHIGDNWVADVEQANRNGITGLFLPKAVEIMSGSNPGIYGGELYQNAFLRNRGTEDYALMFQYYPGVRCMLALAANRFFDDPFVSFNRSSDFNGDPAYVGYAALGPHLMALAKWIEKRADALNVGTVHFVARDGYMVKRAFDLVNRSGVRSSYIRLSRKALMLADVDSPEDLLSLYRKINSGRCSPKKLSSYFAPVISEDRAKNMQEILKAHRFDWDSFFPNENEFYRCLRVYAEEIIDFSLLPLYKKKLKEYFSQQIKPGDYIFDIGYSGRPEAALSNILGFSVGSFYIHDNLDIAEIRRARYGCHNECFYSYKPKITGVMREHLLMELGPSTIGYEEKDGTFHPIFEEFEKEYCSFFVTSVVQENALQYVEDMMRIFGKFQNSMFIPQSIQSAAFEYYLHYSKPFDREIFASLPFEDDIGLGKALRALDLWNDEIRWRGVWQNDGAPSASLPPALSDLYTDGLFVKLYAKLNKWFPKGGRKREFIKKIASLFLH